MALRKTTLSFVERNDQWKLKDDNTNRTIKSFDNKVEETAGGALKRPLGSQGGSVKIQKQKGRYQEERTFRGPLTRNH